MHYNKVVDYSKSKLSSVWIQEGLTVTNNTLKHLRHWNFSGTAIIYFFNGGNKIAKKLFG